MFVILLNYDHPFFNKTLINNFIIGYNYLFFNFPTFLKCMGLTFS